jgi:hypothetical protein
MPDLEHLLRPVHRKLDLIIEELDINIELGEANMTDTTALTAAIAELDADEVAAVAEFKTLEEDIAGLTTSQAPSQAEIDALTQHATAIATALKAGTPAAVVTPPVEPPPVETPVVTPPVETPPVV